MRMMYLALAALVTLAACADTNGTLRHLTKTLLSWLLKALEA